MYLRCVQALGVVRFGFGPVVAIGPTAAGTEHQLEDRMQATAESCYEDGTPFNPELCLTVFML